MVCESCGTMLPTSSKTGGTMLPTPSKTGEVLITECHDSHKHSVLTKEL